MNDITEKLKSALILSCHDAYKFSDNKSHLIDAEYLLTVNAAKKICELNNYFGTPYKIYLEHSTETFATKCTPLIKKDNKAIPIFSKKTIRNISSNTDRDGKIDICVYTPEAAYALSDKPLCSIEIKGFRPSKDKVIDDLKRNLEYFSLAANTGRSELPFNFFISLHNYSNTFTDDKENKNIEKIKRQYGSYLDELSIPDEIHREIIAFTIKRGILPHVNDIEAIQLGLEGDEDFHFIGIIVRFHRKNIIRKIPSPSRLKITHITRRII